MHVFNEKNEKVLMMKRKDHCLDKDHCLIVAVVSFEIPAKLSNSKSCQINISVTRLILNKKLNSIRKEDRCSFRSSNIRYLDDNIQG